MGRDNNNGCKGRKGVTDIDMIRLFKDMFICNYSYKEAVKEKK